MSSKCRKYVRRGALCAACAFWAVRAASVVWAEAGGGNTDEQPAVAPRLFIEPIPGLTTARHLAPDQMPIPLGTELGVFLSVPENAQVTFTGANVASRAPDGVYATCSPGQLGTSIIEAVTVMADGSIFRTVCRLDVVATSIRDVVATGVTAAVRPFEVDENTSNDERVRLFFGESIASFDPLVSTVSAVALDGRRPRGSDTTPAVPAYRTSVERNINLTAIVNHANFGPLMEWRVDGTVKGIGDASRAVFDDVGTHWVEVGPPDRSSRVRIDTYRTIITSHTAGDNVIHEGEWMTFEAVTDPPGFEDQINWLSSTKFGTAEPVVGRGPTFTTLFSGTYGPHPDGGTWQWAGVKANNARLGQDQKIPDCCGIGIDPFATNATVPSSITFGSADIPPIPAGFFGPGSDPVGTPVPFTVDVVGAPRADFNGVQCDTADTFVRRLHPVICPDPPTSPCNPVAIQIVGLSLHGSTPLTVTFDGGQNPETWLLALGLPTQVQPFGTLNAILETATGGTYTATLPVPVTVALVRESAALAPGPNDIKQLTITVDMGLPNPVPWTRITPSDGGFFCPPQGFDIGNEFFPGEPGPGNQAVAAEALAAEGLTCDVCIQCSGAGCHGVPANHTHCICRPVPCPTRCRYDVAVRIPFPFCVGPSVAPSPMKSSFVCNDGMPDADCCGSPGIPPFGMGLYPCLFGGAELVVYINAVVCDP